MTSKTSKNLKSVNEPKFNLFDRGRDYISKILKEGDQMKCLFLDTFTLKLVSSLFFRSELFEFKVFDTLKIENLGTELSQSPNAVCIVKPTKQTIELLMKSLKNTSFKNVSICKKYFLVTFLDFTNTVSNTQLEMIAVSDTQGVVQNIKEIYFEFYP